MKSNLFHCIKFKTLTCASPSPTPTLNPTASPTATATPSPTASPNTEIDCNINGENLSVISQNVLSAEQHLKACMRECFFELSETFPRIFIQKTEAGIKSCTAPAFKRPVSHAVQNLAGGEHLFRAHSRCGLGLMRG